MMNPFHRVTPEALLSHMAEHNKNHLRELEELTAGLEGETKDNVLAAIELFRGGNEKLDAAVALLKKEK